MLDRGDAVVYKCRGLYLRILTGRVGKSPQDCIQPDKEPWIGHKRG